MDLGTGAALRAETERRFDLLDGTLGTTMFQHQNGGIQGIQTTKLVTQSMPIVQTSPRKMPLSHVSCSSGPSDEDPTFRKRQRTSNGPLCCPVPARRMNAPQREPQRPAECDGRIPSRSRDSTLHMNHGDQRDHCPITHPGSRVTALYAELVRELEAQVAELHEILASRDNAAMLREQRIRDLEQENQELRRRVQSLEEQNDALSHREIRSPNAGDHILGPESCSVVVNKSNISFLKNLTGFLETSSNSQLSSPQSFSTPISSSEPNFPSTEALHSPVLPPRPDPGLSNHTVSGPPNSTSADMSDGTPEGMLRVSGVTSGYQYWMNMEDGGENTIPESCVQWEEPLQETLPDGTPAWASPVESNGRPKLELVPTSGVYITYQQLEDLSQIPPDKPKLMTRRLLDYFFSRETLARSSATGQRIAHNNTTMEKPLRLPVAVVTAIKAYVTRACGRGCNFNAVINSKCGTSRRAVKKMSIRIDWTEAGRQNCARTVPGTEVALSP
ncbi:uncharacterized protein O3C94_020518 [Discoglossus pictus]